MAKKTKHSAHRSSLPLSPIHPSLHFILFLGLAFILVVIVAFVMQQTAATSRATLVCPQLKQDQRALIEELSNRCPDGVQYTRDNNGCGVWVCKPDTLGAQSKKPIKPRPSGLWTVPAPSEIVVP